MEFYKLGEFKKSLKVLLNTGDRQLSMQLPHLRIDLIKGFEFSESHGEEAASGKDMFRSKREHNIFPRKSIPSEIQKHAYLSKHNKLVIDINFNGLIKNAKRPGQFLD